jgi:glutathione S-transferase
MEDMPVAIVERPRSALVPRLRGLHLFGFDGAPCSQRVSFALAEKGIRRARSVRWDSDAEETLTAAAGTYLFRPVSLPRKEHLSDGYAAIQPNMVVPAFVHDGTLHIESMDIVDAIDRTWPEPALMPADPECARLALELVELGKSLHVSVRYVSFHWGLGRLGRIGTDHEETIRRLERSDSPEQLLEFYQRYNRGAIDAATFLRHLHALESGWGAQEQRLRADGRPFLTGSTFSRADMIWAIKVLRIFECGYPFRERFPSLYEWFLRVRARPGFQQGVLGPNRMAHRLFRVKAAVERLLGAGIARVATGPAR